MKYDELKAVLGVTKRGLYNPLPPNQNRFGNISKDFSLLTDAVASGKSRILEIGTFTGWTTLNMRINLEDVGYIVTIDRNKWVDSLPREPEMKSSGGQYLRYAPGESFVEAGADRIVQLYGDSSSPWIRSFLQPHQFDLFFIDGDHSYEGVKKDVELCLTLAAPGAVVVVDDYDQNAWPGVFQYINELSESRDVYVSHSWACFLS